MRRLWAGAVVAAALAAAGCGGGGSGGSLPDGAGVARISGFETIK